MVVGGLSGARSGGAARFVAEGVVLATLALLERSASWSLASQRLWLSAVNNSADRFFPDGSVEEGRLNMQLALANRGMVVLHFLGWVFLGVGVGTPVLPPIARL